jgi:hypothetical protein
VDREERGLEFTAPKLPYFEFSSPISYLLGILALRRLLEGLGRDGTLDLLELESIAKDK